MLGPHAIVADSLATWGAGAAVAVAIFTGFTFLLTWLGYLHVRDVAGRRKPLEIARATWPNFEYHPKSLNPRYRIAESSRDHFRIGLLYVFNHADSQQALGVGGFGCGAHRTRMLWPNPRKTKARLALQSLVFEPKDGGVVPLLVMTESGWWPEDEIDTEASFRPTYKRKYWFWISGRTAGNRRIRYLGRLLLIPYDPELIPKPKSE